MNRMIRLEDICIFMTGGTPSTSVSEYYENGDIPWIVSGDIHQGEIYDCEKRITKLGLEKSNAKYLPKNSVLIALNGQGKTRGTVALLKVDGMTCNQSIVSIVPQKDMQLDVVYLFQILRSMYKKIRNITGDKDRAGLNIPLLKSIEIPLPPLAEQKQIAAILDAADSLRQKDQQLVEHYTALSQSLFLEMFGDLTASDLFQAVNAMDVIDIRDGTHDSPRYVNEGFPLITSKNIKNGNLDFSQVNFISQQDYDQIQKRSAVALGDIIMPMIGTIGNPHLVISEPNFAIKNVALYKFENTDKVKNIFIYYLLNSYYFDRYVTLKNKGGTQKFLSLGDLRKMPVIVPPMELQNQFAERIAIIEKQKQQAQANLQKSEALFNSLLQRAFTGELTANKAA